MNDYYRILGVSSSASAREIRRAYRALARRYHPDLNPTAQTAELFRQITEAYNVLNDSTERQRYDALRLHETASARGAQMRTTQAYAAHSSSDAAPRDTAASRATRTARAAGERPSRPTPGPQPSTSPPPQSSRATPGNGLPRFTLRRALSRLVHRVFPAPAPLVCSAVLEITVREAVRGVRKKIEVQAEEGIRVVPVSVPPGCLPGQVLKLRSKKRPAELIIVVIRHAPHPVLSLSRRGLTMEVPLTIHEALSGGSITVPTLTTPISVRIPRGPKAALNCVFPRKGFPWRAIPAHGAISTCAFGSSYPMQPKRCRSLRRLNRSINLRCEKTLNCVCARLRPVYDDK